MRYETRISLNFFLGSKKQTIFVIIGIAFGVAIQIFIATIVASVQRDIIAKLLGNIPHIVMVSGDSRDSLEYDKNDIVAYGNYILDRNRISNSKMIIENLQSDPAIKDVVEAFEQSAIYTRGSREVALQVKGVDLKKADHIYDVISRVKYGEYVSDPESVLVGVRFANNYSLKVGDMISLKLGKNSPHSFKISGIFDLEQPGPNSDWVIMDLDRLRNMYKEKNYVTSIVAQVNDVFSAGEVAEKMKALYKNLEIYSWMRDGGQLTKAIRNQTASSAIIQVVVTLATAMSIVSVLYITVVQKSKDIGILKAMGLSNRGSAHIFLIQGVFFGVTGAILGIIFGYFIVVSYAYFANPFYTPTITFTRIVICFVSSTLTGAVAAIIPAIKSSHLTPIEVIRGE